jgi:hypothetical protein
MSKLNVLYIYSCGEFPPRKTVASFIDSFQKYSDHRVFYHNISFGSLPGWLNKVRFDVVIYSHFITTPWNRESYRRRLKQLEKFPFTGAVKVAFFQDEYVNTDLTAELIDRLGVSHVFTVAPLSEVPKIYANVMSKSVSYHQYLTGYVDESDLDSFGSQFPRTIDLGYRTGWPSIEMIRLGKFGAMKYRIAEEFLKHTAGIRADIKIGEGFLKGQAWFNFLKRCRFMLGVESGASMLDEDGSIYERIRSRYASTRSTDFEDFERNCFPGKDGNLKLKAISPRVFEAAMAKTAMVLVEGYYNGIIQAGVHYLPVKKDFSNVAEVVKQLDDESLRNKLAENTYRDLIASGSFSYRKFVGDFYQCLNLTPASKTSGSVFLVINRVQDSLSWCKVLIWTLIPASIKRKILKA